MDEDFIIVDNIRADHVEAGDLVIVEGDRVEVSYVGDMEDDPDGVVIKGYSHTTGDTETFEVYFGDAFDVWTA